MAERQIRNSAMRDEARRVMNALLGSDQEKVKELLASLAAPIKESVLQRIAQIQALDAFPIETFFYDGGNIDKPAIHVKVLNSNPFESQREYPPHHVLLFPEGKLIEYTVLPRISPNVFSFRVREIPDDEYVLMAKEVYTAMGNVIASALKDSSRVPQRV